MMERYLVWLPLVIAIAAGAAGYLDTRATAADNEDDINKLESKSEKWAEERRINREAQIRYEVRQEQMKAEQKKTNSQLEQIRQLIQELNTR